MCPRQESNLQLLFRTELLYPFNYEDFKFKSNTKKPILELAFLCVYDKILFMDPESKELLQATFKLAEENNKLLHKVRGVQKRATLWTVARYVLIIGIALGSFYFIEPYLIKIMDLYSSVSGIQQKMDNNSLQNLLKKF